MRCGGPFREPDGRPSSSLFWVSTAPRRSWGPRTVIGYHGVDFGHLVAALDVRADELELVGGLWDDHREVEVVEVVGRLELSKEVETSELSK